MKESDAFQSKDNGGGMCTCTMSRKHRPQEREAKWFQAEKALGRFKLGGEEEL
jgi:hypothetical protein